MADVAARALDDYDAESQLREVEVQCAQWQRIELVMRASGIGRYRPEEDPDVGEGDLTDPFTRDT